MAQSNSIKKEIKKYTKTKCIYFPAWSEDVIIKNKTKKIKKTKRIKILFAGNIGEAQSFLTLIRCAKLIKNKNLVKWIIVGDGRWKNKLSFHIKKNNLENDFQLIKHVPLKKIGSFLNSVDGLYLSLQNKNTFKKTIPGKLQTYMKSGKPIIASISGETEQIIKKSKCGFVSKAEDSNSLAKNVLKFCKMKQKDRLSLGKNGKIFANKFFNKKNILINLEKEFKIIL